MPVHLANAQQTATGAARGLVTTVVGRARRPWARRRLLRTLAEVPQPYRLEIGAGRTRRPGWVEGDVSWRARHYLDAASPWPVPDGSASHVYADNVVEHLRMAPGRVLLREAFRVLRPGGRIRLVTPDVQALAQLYLAGGPDARAHMTDASSRGYEVHHSVDLLRIVFQEAGHAVGYLWDQDALSSELTAAGFVDVVRCAVGESDDPDLAGLEAREDVQGRRSVMLVLEARRP